MVGFTISAALWYYVISINCGYKRRKLEINYFVTIENPGYEIFSITSILLVLVISLIRLLNM